MKNILNDLKERGILKQYSNLDKFYNLNSNDVVYAGFDPTAQSLHLGNYIQIALLLRMKRAGWKTIALVGGATGMIGDPSFRNSERKLLNQETLDKNKGKIKKQLESFGLEVLDNYEFYKNMNFLTFLRDAGKLINIAYMLSKDSVSSRIEKGLSFTEFSYQLIQGWDFIKLYEDYNVRIQIGGSDQWGNISTGLEMISKKIGDDHKAFIFTSNLLTDENGNKFGKSTGGGNLWLDKNITKPFDMYQFLIKQPDSQLDKLFKWLTFLSINEINNILSIHNQNPSLQCGQKKLAYEIIKDVHGEQEALKVQEISDILFNKNLDLNNISINTIKSIDNEIQTIKVFKNDNIVDKIIENKLLNSKREAREFISNNAIKFNYLSINENSLFNSNYFNGEYGILHIGKKRIYLVYIKNS
ncbi:tyrosine--tRNA ligase [Mycoplasmopsis felis]|uniref:tyrosine--tRNA ligase n=1 Tax=Mycoplasmopsis felis TaxID=33923 RepID=UPI002B001869|nr:tyrosine--tRNA ligase [Mycoplasmopsis felis]WQQ03870.1 tyrosine--tRNA ligase [Mycoplasmopsis felis]